VGNIKIRDFFFFELSLPECSVLWRIMANHGGEIGSKNDD
jgi:hypothetical protein